MPDADLDRLLAQVPADGSPIGNQSLREALGGNEKRYDAARDALVEAGKLEKGRGKLGDISNYDQETNATTRRSAIVNPARN